LITIDDREISEHPEILDLLDVPTVVQRLEAGDYAFLGVSNEPIGIERSEIGNLIAKLRSGALESQLRKCEEAYNTLYLLVEGVYDHVGGLLAVHRQSDRGYYRNHIYPSTRYADITALLVRLEELGIRIVHSPNFDCSMKLVSIIYHQETKPEGGHSLFKKIRPIKIPVKASSNPAVPKLLALISRMPEKVAIRLINRYGTIWDILNAPDEELLAVEGLGRGLLERMKREVGKV